MELAGRLDRLWAAIIDRLCVLALITVPTIMFVAARHSDLMGLTLGLFGVSFFGLLGVQVWLLTTKGQTLGKKALGLRIVKVSDMTNGGFVTNVLLRSAIGWAFALVPKIGGIYGLADALMIFREDRRCIHDHIAGTCVVKETPEP